MVFSENINQGHQDRLFPQKWTTLVIVWAVDINKPSLGASTTDINMTSGDNNGHAFQHALRRQQGPWTAI